MLFLRSWVKNLQVPELENNRDILYVFKGLPEKDAQELFHFFKNVYHKAFCEGV